MPRVLASSIKQRYFFEKIYKMIVRVEEMLDSTISVIISKLFDSNQDAKDNDKLIKSVKESILRELRFNRELFKEMEKNTKDRLNIIKYLKTNNFDRLEENYIPLTLFFNSKETSIFKEIISENSQKITNKNYLKWIANCNTAYLLIEKIYHRIKILKVLEKNNIIKNKTSLGYTKFLLMLTDKILQSEKNRL